MAEAEKPTAPPTANTHYLSFNQVRQGLALEFDAEDIKVTSDMLRRDLPLRHDWALWEQYEQPARDKAFHGGGGGAASNYNDMTRQVAVFSTVQEFWALWNHVPQPSSLLEGNRIVRRGADGTPDQPIGAFMVSRGHIRPEWEDAGNTDGGSFLFNLRLNAHEPRQVDEFWNNLVLAVVGSTLPHPDCITGVRLSDKLTGMKSRVGLRVEVWVDSRAQDETLRNELQVAIQNAMSAKLDGEQARNLPRADFRKHG